MLRQEPPKVRSGQDPLDPNKALDLGPFELALLPQVQNLEWGASDGSWLSSASLLQPKERVCSFHPSATVRGACLLLPLGSPTNAGSDFGQPKRQMAVFPQLCEFHILL